MNDRIFLHHDGIGFDMSMLKQYFDSHRSDATFTKTSSMLDDSTVYDTVTAKIGFMSFTFTVAKKDSSSQVVSVSYDGFTCDDDDALIDFISDLFIDGRKIEKKEGKEIKKGEGYKEALIAAAQTISSIAMLFGVCIFHAMHYVH